MVIFAVNGMATIDAAAMSRITGVPVSTLNVWVQRELVPGVSVGRKGVAREFDLDTVMHIAITSALVQIGYGAAFASLAASEALAKGVDSPGAKLIIGPPSRPVYGIGGTPTINYVAAKTAKDLKAFLDGFADGRPEAFTIVELDKLATRVRKAFTQPDLAEQTRRQRGAPER